MTRKQQDALPMAVKREPIGTVEKAAARDLRQLEELGMMTTGTTALAATYRRAARMADRAEREHNAWAAATAMRELRATRLELAPTAAPLAGDGLTDLLESIAQVVRENRETDRK